VRAKLSVLRACRRVLRPGGRLGFLTIRVADGLSPAQRRRAVAVGPPAPGGPDGHALAERSGFTDVRTVDVTADYLATARMWLSARERLREQLRPLGPQEYDDKIAQGRSAVLQIEAGRLRRVLVVARRPR
jgi:hypothetical protein